MLAVVADFRGLPEFFFPFQIFSYLILFFGIFSRKGRQLVSSKKWLFCFLLSRLRRADFELSHLQSECANLFDILRKLFCHQLVLQADILCQICRYLFVIP